MNIASGPAENVPRETLLDRVFTFLGLALVCGGGMLAFSADTHLWKGIWPDTPADAEQLATASFCWPLLLIGTTCVAAGGLFVGKRRIFGGLLLVVAVAAYLAFADSR